MARDPIVQLDFKDPELRGHGCTLATLAWLAREVTDGGAFEPGKAEEYVARLRKLSGVTGADFLDRGTTMTEAQQGYEALRFDGRLDPRMRMLLGGSVRDDLMPELQAGRWALVAVNYAVAQDAGVASPRSSFRGGHAIAVGRPKDGEVTVIDPLRSKPVRWPIDLLERAMETFGTKPWGGGRGNAGVAYPSPTYREAYTDALRTIKRNQTALDAAQSKIVAARDRAKLAEDERDAANVSAKLATDALGEVAAARDKFKRDLSMVAAERDALTVGKAALVVELAACETERDGCNDMLAECQGHPVADCSAVEAQARQFEADLSASRDRVAEWEDWHKRSPAVAP